MENIELGETMLHAGNWFGIAIMATILGTASGTWSQVIWQTTHTSNQWGGFNSGSCELSNASLRVKTHAAYLDVEEDIEIGTLGSVDAGNDAKTLEIVGNFRLPPGAAITGALLWDGGRILQGKLLDRNLADSLYEAQVERNSTPPPRPRDPLILEMIGKGQYRFKIYPVELGRSRHFRLRYQLPPVIAAEGMQITLVAAIASLFPGSPTQVSVTLENGGDASKIVFAANSGSRTEMVLPRTRLMAISELSGPQTAWDPFYYNQTFSPGTVIYPIDRLRQVSVKTSFPDGQMAGHYLNLYTGVTDEVLGGIGKRVEIVFYWKWNTPSQWIQSQWGGEYETPRIWEAQNQGSILLALYGQLGGAGTKVGLLHDDSKSAPHSFAAASRNERSYDSAMAYLGQVQGGYVGEFVRNLRAVKPSKGKSNAVLAQESKSRFLTNLRLVKTLYSPAENSIKHLVLLSVGDDFGSDDLDGNAALDSIFGEGKLTLSNPNEMGFAQAGFDMWEAKRSHTYVGPAVQTPWMALPGLPMVNMNVVVRNRLKAYDFGIRCEGGLDMSCGTLTFHGKSDSPWSDSLEWEAHDKDGKLLGKATTAPTVIEREKDTAIALLWAGSESPFSEKKELPLGPVYGFVDRWASLLSLPKDSLDAARAEAYADSGVPNIANTSIKDVIPNYQEGSVPNGGDQTTALAARMGALSDPSQWKVERSRGNLVIRIPGLAAGLAAEAVLFDLAGKRAASWAPRSVEGALNLSAVGARPGVYLLQIRIAGMQAVKRINL